MKQHAKKLFLLTIFFNSTALPMAAFDFNNVAPFIQFRSQSRDTPRKLVGTTSHHVYLDDMDSFYGTFNMTAQYDHSFRPGNLAETLFGNSLINAPNTGNNCDNSCDNRTLIVSGLLSTDRNNTTDLMAENFLLPRDFRSALTFRPLVQDFLVDFYLYVGLDEWVKGLYFRVYGPVVNNRITLHAEETIISAGTAATGLYPTGYFSGTVPVPTDQLLPSALSFFSGNNLAAPVTDITFNPLLFAKITPCGNRSKTGFAELRGEFGWNYLHENYHVGINVQSAAPTGKRPNGEFLFENQIGNGKHWELGVGLSAHWTMWRSEDEDHHFDFVFEADITHLFKAKQHRTFDLIGKPLSRYMLAENLISNANATNPLSGSSNANVQFGNTYSPVANFSTRDVHVTIGVQGDIVAMFNYTARGFSWDFGYNFWGMSREHIELSLSDSNTAFPEQTWALKGDASIAGQADVDGTEVPVFLAATESNANVHIGTNQAQTNLAASLANPFIDTPVPATTGTALTPVFVITESTTPINTSQPPVFITVNDLNIKGAEISGTSNKVFTHFSYTWIDREDWVPYLGVGFNAEFGSHSHNDNGDTNNNGPCDGHVSCALSKWAILVKGGVSFD